MVAGLIYFKVRKYATGENCQLRIIDVICESIIFTLFPLRMLQNNLDIWVTHVF